MNISGQKLEGMLIENSDEPYAKEISTVILSEIRKGNAITTTTRFKKQSKALVRVPAEKQKETVKKSCARTFRHLALM